VLLLLLLLLCCAETHACAQGAWAMQWVTSQTCQTSPTASHMCSKVCILPTQQAA
jgi:hypothetical protein